MFAEPCRVVFAGSSKSSGSFAIRFFVSFFFFLFAGKTYLAAFRNDGSATDAAIIHYLIPPLWSLASQKRSLPSLSFSMVDMRLLFCYTANRSFSESVGYLGVQLFETFFPTVFGQSKSRNELNMDTGDGCPIRFLKNCHGACGNFVF